MAGILQAGVGRQQAEEPAAEPKVGRHSRHTGGQGRRGPPQQVCNRYKNGTGGAEVPW